MKIDSVKYECLKLADKLLFEQYVSKQIKFDLLLKTYPGAATLYIENSPEPPTVEDVIEYTKTLYSFIVDTGVVTK